MPASIWGTQPISSGNQFITPFEHGGIPDPTIDNSAAILAALRAASNGNRSEGTRIVDLRGLPWGVGPAIQASGLYNVGLINGTLEGLAGFDGSWVIKWGNGDVDSAEECYMNNVQVNCANHTRPGIGCNGTREFSGYNLRVYKYSTYGMRNWRAGSGGSRWDLFNCYTYKHYFNDARRGLFAYRTGIGISQESADSKMTNCNAVYGSMYFNTCGGGQLVNLHPFNGDIDDFPEWVITSVTNNGSGKVRVSLATDHEFVTGDYCVLPYLTGLATQDRNSLLRAWRVTVVGAKIIDLLDYDWPGGTYTGVDQTVINRADEPLSFHFGPDTGQMSGSNLYIDNGKFLIEASAETKLHMSGNLIKTGKSDNRCGVELVATAANTDLAGINLKVFFSNISSDYRLHAPTGTSFAANLKCHIMGSSDASGTPVIALGRSPVPVGTRELPSVPNTYETDIPDAYSVDINSGYSAIGKGSGGYSSGGYWKIRYTETDVILGDKDRALTSDAKLTGKDTESKRFIFQSNDLNRVSLGVNADAGGGAGGNLNVNMFDDAGTFLYTAFSVDRDTGRFVAGPNGTTPVHRYNTLTQTTVGAAGPASALPATPEGYEVVNINGTERVIAYYKKS